MKLDRKRHSLPDAQRHQIRKKHGLSEPVARLIAELHFGGRRGG